MGHRSYLCGSGQGLTRPNMAQIPNEERKTLVLTGASRGIGHAAVKRFSLAGWRVMTCSRHSSRKTAPGKLARRTTSRSTSPIRTILSKPSP